MEVCWKLYNIKLENRPYTEVSFCCIALIISVLAAIFFIKRYQGSFNGYIICKEVKKAS